MTNIKCPKYIEGGRVMARLQYEQMRCDRCKETFTDSILDYRVFGPEPLRHYVRHYDLCEQCRADLRTAFKTWMMAPADPVVAPLFTLWQRIKDALCRWNMSNEF